MKSYTYKCEKGHTFEIHYVSMSKALEAIKRQGNDLYPCRAIVDGDYCCAPSHQVLSAPSLHFLGTGWTNPVPSGRVQTKGADASKVAAEVTQEFGAKNWVNAVKQGS